MKMLLTVAVVLMLLGAVMLLADIGSSGVWIATITVGIALVLVVERNNKKLIRR